MSIPKGYDPSLYRIRHSAAHVLAQAVIERFGTEGAVQLGGGPPIADGFYYDFLLPRTVTPEDLEWIEARMKALVAGHHPFRHRTVSEDEARKLFSAQPFKLELIDGITRGNLDDDGNERDDGEAPELGIYEHDAFMDLCAGPHVENTREIPAEGLKVLTSSGAYWRGDERRPMLQRIYATAFKQKAELDEYLHLRAEAERRDHRKLGKELELFHMDPTAPGMPYWLPKGFRLLRELLDFWREEHESRDYQEISAPLLNDRSLWETSGHWEHYHDNMFLAPVDEHRTFAVKPMNCPNAMIVYRLKVRSYRDFPLRLSDCDMLHRNERSGTLHGLLRVQKFQQDDAHIFVTPDMIEAEYGRIFEICKRFYDVFELNHRFRLGTRPEKFLGDVETWDRAEAALRRILDAHCGPGGYDVAEGDGAFYGPKVDILMDDALKRSWQMGTIQLDFQLPARFGCKYSDQDGTLKTPVVIHRVIYGSFERFIGILIEHFAGAFPVWVSPVHAKLIPVTDAQNEYAGEVAAMLRGAKIRTEIDDANERMGNKIRKAQLEKVPYMLVLGKREVEARAVSVRLRTGEDLGAIPIETFIGRVREVVSAKKGL